MRSLVVQLPVLALLAACGGASTQALHVTASTPPDAAHVVVTRATEGTAPTTVYDHVFTSAADVAKLFATLNEAPDGTASSKHGPPCPFGAAPQGPIPQYLYDFTFTAQGGQPVERVLFSLRCAGMGIQRGWAPSLALEPEISTNVDMNIVLAMTHFPVDMPPQHGTAGGYQP